MSRSGYSDDYDQWAMIRWRGAVSSAMRGKRGRAFLQELLTALDALPEHKLCAYELEEGGLVCALGSVGKARGLDMKEIDPWDRETVAKTFGIPRSLAMEIMYMNDEGFWGDEMPEFRWSRMRRWVARLIDGSPE